MLPQYRVLYNKLLQHIDAERLIHDSLRTLAYGADASFYRLVPELVVRVNNEEEVRFVLRQAYELGIAVTFRAAGTSLSGQAVTDAVLIQLSDQWQGYQIYEQGQVISLQPGIIGARANQLLAPYQRKIGPDPASINACMIGGIAANNSSGMCCGTAQNSYHTVKSMRIILADGTLLDTADSESRFSFEQSHAKLLSELKALSVLTKNNSDLKKKIEHKYRLKNTTGYSINSLVDFDDPFDILMHLMIGSEGTLGFISEVTYHTVEEHPIKAAALIYFADMKTTCQAVMQLTSAPVSAVELIDRASLRSVEAKPGMPALLKDLGDDVASLLVDVRAATPLELEENISQIFQALAGIETLYKIEFTKEKVLYETYWNLRKGMLPAVGAMRRVGTTVLIEDVALPVERLAEGILELQNVFQKYGYSEAVLFGHALEGNLHFIFTQSFDSPDEVKRYKDLMEEVANIVAVKYNGSLKAEHGTGRNMAPYVLLEWGQQAYDIMWQIKKAFDPTHILNPDVILSRNANIHVQNLKPMAQANDKIDACIECGFCESTCPSRSLTLTPRQRIVLWREIRRLERSGEAPQHLANLRQQYDYQGIDSCAACGLCSTKCPVGINTGDLTRELRHDRYGDSKVGYWVADHFAGTMQIARAGLKVAGGMRSVFGDSGMQAITGFTNKLTGGIVPKWHPQMPRAASMPDYILRVQDDRPSVVYIPSCATRVMGAGIHAEDKRTVTDVMFSVLERAGYKVIIPDSIDSQCCGMAFQSKGQFAAAKRKANDLNSLLMQESQQGRLPIVCDTSPCLLQMKETLSPELTLYEQVEFLAKHVLPNLTVDKKIPKMALHITCSTTRMGLGQTFVELAGQLADEVVIPPEITCCGFAGDKGFSLPELNKSALKTLRLAVEGCEVGYSNSRTCEIGLTEYSGIEYQSIVYLVDELTR